MDRLAKCRVQLTAVQGARRNDCQFLVFELVAAIGLTEPELPHCDARPAAPPGAMSCGALCVHDGGLNVRPLWQLTRCPCGRVLRCARMMIVCQHELRPCASLAFFLKHGELV